MTSHEAGRPAPSSTTSPVVATVLLVLAVATLETVMAWLQEHDDRVMVVVGFTFAVVFGLEALQGFGIL